jgi:uncharacterized protein YciI
MSEGQVEDEKGGSGTSLDELERPQSMLSPRVKQTLLEVIEREEERAIKENDTEYLVDLQNAKKLILRGAWKVRRDNPYLYFMAQCLLGRGGSLKDTQQAMRECAEAWRNLSPEKKREFEALAKNRLAVYDYL